MSSDDEFEEGSQLLEELERRISTLTAALSEKAEENIDLYDKLTALQQRGSGAERWRKERKELKDEISQLKEDRATQEELNQEFQRRITTLSICLTDLAETNTTILTEKIPPKTLVKFYERNLQVENVGRQASLGLVDIPEGQPLDETISITKAYITPKKTPASHAGSNEIDEPVTPGILQDYQSEIERLKFKVKKRKAKIQKLRKTYLAQKDRSDSAVESVKKYEKYLKKMQRRHEEDLKKENARRKKSEATIRRMKRKIAELEFLLEEEVDQLDQGNETEEDF